MTEQKLPTTTVNGDVYVSIPALKATLNKAADVLALTIVAGIADVRLAGPGMLAYEAVVKVLDQTAVDALDSLTGL